MSKSIPLTRGRSTLVDDADYPWLVQWKWHYTASGYAASTVRTNGDMTYLYMHRLLLDPQPGQHVDHINGDKLDNRRANLRLVDIAQNQHNRRPNAHSASGYKGVCWHRNEGRWQVRIQAYGQRICLGYFDDEVEAALAYDAAARQLHGEYARLNFPDEME